jgi:phosphoglycerate dehydrogenase-like enzyme
MLIYIDMELREKEKQLLKSNTGDTFQLYFQSESTDDDERLKMLKAAEIILGNPDPDWLLQATNLKWIQLHSAGFEKYHSIPVSALATNMQDYYSQPCAETMLAGIMALYRKMDELSLLKEKKRWVGAPIRTQLGLLYNRKIIILGTGNIGRRMAKILSGFDVQILFYGRTAADAAIRSREALLSKIPWADIIIGCLPGTPETKGFFTNEMISSMQQHALFCNVGRGNLLEDENALIEALLHHKIGGAVLDVTTVEPIPPNSKLWNCPNTILSQHSGGGQQKEFEGIVDLFLQNLHQYVNKQPLQNRIDFMKGY